MHKYFFVIVSFALLAACNKTEIDNSLHQKSTYRDFYAIYLGKEMIYQIDSIVPAAFGVRLDTTSGYIKDVVAERNIENKDTVYIINRFSSKNQASNNWNYLYSYSAKLKENTLEITEKEYVQQEEPMPINGLVTLNFIKLSNPINENISWDGNRYFTQGNAGTASYLYKYNGWQYQYSNIGNSVQILNTTYPESITIVSSNQLSGDPNIQKPKEYQLRIYSEEIYAKGVGLVHKNFMYSDYQPTNSSSPGYQAKSLGIILNLVSVK